MGKSYWLSSGFYALLDRLTQMVFNLGGVVLLFRMLDKGTCSVWVIFLTVTSFIEVARIGLLQNGMISFLASADKREHPKILTASVVLNVALSVFCAFLLVLGANGMAYFFDKDPILPTLFKVYALTTFAFTALYQFNFIQQANLDFKGLFWSSFVKNGGLFAYILYLFVFQKTFTLIDLAICQLLSTIPSAVVAYWFAKKYTVFDRQIDRFWLGKLFDYGKFAMGTNFFTMLFKNVDKTLLGRFLKDSVSTYDLALKVNQLAEVPTMTLALILFPQSARRNTEGGDTKAAAKYLYEKSVGVLLALIVPMTLGVLLLADVIVLLIGSAKYANAANILRLTVFYSIFSAYAIQFGTILDSIQKPNLNFYITTLGAIVNLGCNWFFISKFGFYGAAYGTLIGMTLMFLVMQFVLNKAIRTQPLNAFVYMIAFYREIFLKIKNIVFKKLGKNSSENFNVKKEALRVEVIDQNAPILRGWVNDED